MFVFSLQVAVKAIRTALLSCSNHRELLTLPSSPAMSSKRKFPVSTSLDRVSSDLINPSPRPSPPLNRRANGTVGNAVMNGFDKVREGGRERKGGRRGGGREKEGRSIVKRVGNAPMCEKVTNVNASHYQEQCGSLNEHYAL